MGIAVGLERGLGAGPELKGGRPWAARSQILAGEILALNVAEAVGLERADKGIGLGVVFIAEVVAQLGLRRNRIDALHALNGRKARSGFELRGQSLAIVQLIGVICHLEKEAWADRAALASALAIGRLDRDLGFGTVLGLFTDVFDQALQFFGLKAEVALDGVDAKGCRDGAGILAEEHGKQGGEVGVLLLGEVAGGEVFLSLFVAVVFAQGVEGSNDGDHEGQEDIGDLLDAVEAPVE